MSGTCAKCQWLRTVKPASQLLAGTFPPDTSDVAQALGKVVEDEQKQRDAEADSKRAQSAAGKSEWLAAPVMTAYCGVREADGVYYIPEIRNADQRCDTHEPAPRELHPCRDCVHAIKGTGPARDESHEQTYVDVAARNVSAGVEKDTTDSLLKTYRDGVSARKALELAGAYQTRGQLLNKPYYLSWCEVYSTPDTFSVCIFQNPQHNCPEWEARPAEMPAQVPTTTAPMSPPTTRIAPGDMGPTPEDRPPPPYSPPSTERSGSTLSYSDTDVLVDGPAPLTGALLRRIQSMFDWILDVQISDAQWQEISGSIINDWKTLDASGAQGINSLLELHKTALAEGPDGREYLREAYQPGLVGTLRSQTDPMSQTLLSLYEQANPPIAPGSPPLTQEVVDSYLGILSFVDALMENRPWAPMNEGVRMLFTQQMSAGYQALPTAQQQWLATLPLEWAKTRVLWQTGSELDRAQIRDQLISFFGQAAQSTPALRQDAVRTTAPVFGVAEPGPGAAVPVKAEAIDVSFDSVVEEQRKEEERLEKEDPMLARQVKLQNQVANASMMSNMMKMQHESTMAIIKNITY